MVQAVKDTHEPKKGEMQVLYCVRGTPGWALLPEIESLLVTPPIEKSTYGCVDLCKLLESYHKLVAITELTIVGLRTDVSIISCALLFKSFLPDTRIIVDASCCAGSTPEKHLRALNAMRACMVTIENER